MEERTVKTVNIGNEDSFPKIYNYYSEVAKSSQNLWLCVKSLSTELENVKASRNVLKQQLIDISVTLSQPSSTVSCATLNGKLRELQNENASLKRKLVEERETRRIEFKDLEQKFESVKKAAVKEYVDQIEKEKLAFEDKERELNFEFQSQLTVASAEYREMESHLQSLLMASNAKLKEADISCASLRNELFHLQNRFTSAVADQTSYLETKLRYTEERLKNVEQENTRLKCEKVEIVMNRSCNSTSHNQSVANTSNIDIGQHHVTEQNVQKPQDGGKYIPLQVNYGSDKDKDRNLQTNAYNHRAYSSYSGSNRQDFKNSAGNSYSNSSNISRSKLPALEPVTDVTQKRNVSKKRKLFSRDVTDHLHTH